MDSYAKDREPDLRGFFSDLAVRFSLHQSARGSPGDSLEEVDEKSPRPRIRNGGKVKVL